MTIKTDQTTGLPKLPEDHFWRIGPNRMWNSSLHGGVQIWKKVEGPWRDIYYDYGWGGPSLDRLMYDYETRDYERLVEGKRFLGIPISPPRVRQVRQARRVAELVFNESFDSIESPPQPNPENVVSLAVKVLLKWEAEIAREKMYGDYPPKKLGTAKSGGTDD